MLNRFKFQFKTHNGEWIELDDTLFMERLYKYHDKLTPLVKRMINGEILAFPDGEYKICLAE